MELTLSEKTYLSEVIDLKFPEFKSKSYEIASAFTYPQRRLFLDSLFNKDYEKAKEIVENVVSFQTSIK